MSATFGREASSSADPEVVERVRTWTAYLESRVNSVMFSMLVEILEMRRGNTFDDWCSLSSSSADDEDRLLW